MKIVCELYLWAQVILPLSHHNYLAWYHYQLNKISVQYLTDMNPISDLMAYVPLQLNYHELTESAR